MNLYETLGVAPDASADDIRQAFRKRAAKTHPDRAGGNEAEFKAINEAYGVLGDHEKRARYDSTGSIKEPPTLDTEARDMLMHIATRALESDVPVLVKMRAILDEVSEEVTEKIGNLKRRIARIERRNGKVKSKGPTNLVQSLIDQQLTEARRQVEQLEHLGRVRKMAVKMLEDYTEESEPMLPTNAAPRAAAGIWFAGTRPWT